ncbi:hypothetical protein [Vibrio sp. THAF190c]|jgi:hypothetical protein|uniref:hypothetical protein n=1 Tax=Vibrio sp. THAF190c TaxID=2587865 RepID=UPI0012695078|nr:hypothetical protein [Vibrio sp. THAF190c]QFT13380.1 hypothetical protein FIV04_25855 [Vibrio sp. THAF190c]
MNFEAIVNLENQDSGQAMAIKSSINQANELVHPSGRKGQITTNSATTVDGESSLLLNIDYEPEHGNLTISDFEDGRLVWSGRTKLTLKGIH